jgi:hypothetical protein
MAFFIFVKINTKKLPLMKKFLIATAVLSLFGSTVNGQEKSADFDKKFRFGLRVNPQPTWFVSGDKNNIPSGAKFGIGFGLNMERRLSDIVGVLFGVGADFEGGKYTFKNDPANNYVPTYWMNESEGTLSVPKKENLTQNSIFELKERTVKTTYVSIPVMLKLSTNEYSGLKYFGVFGGEIGIRAKAIAEDSYYRTIKYTSDTSYKVISNESTMSDIDVSKEFSAVPIRVGFNAGIGAEYRLGGSTSAFISINYFRSLTNQMRKESDYTYFRTDPVTGNRTFIKQDLKLSAIRINIGIMF